MMAATDRGGAYIWNKDLVWQPWTSFLDHGHLEDSHGSIFMWIRMEGAISDFNGRTENLDVKES